MPGLLHGLCAVLDVELAVDVAGVGFDGGEGDMELLGKGLVGVAKGDEFEHFELSGAKWVELVALQRERRRRRLFQSSLQR